MELTSNAYGGYFFDEKKRRIDFSYYRCDAITDQALNFINEYDKKSEKPFFLTVSHIEPHHQNDAHHYQGPSGSKDKFKNFEIPGDLIAFPEGDWKEEYPDYLGACESIDYNLGRIVANLKEKGIYEDTVIIFTSDHGSHFRTRNRDKNLNGYDDYKRTCHEAAIHVPLVIAGGPFHNHGKRIKELVSTASIPKTIATLAGCHVDSIMIGERLQDIANGIVDPKRKNEVFVQISESRLGRCIRTEKWKYSVVAPGINGGDCSSSNIYVDDFLYDLEADPFELHNLVDDKRFCFIKEKLRCRLKTWIKEAEHLDVLIKDGI